MTDETVPYLTYDEWKARSNNDNHLAKTIPLTMFRTCEYAFDDLPHEIKEILQFNASQDPQYTYVLFDKNSRRRFIEETFPEYLAAYDSIIPGAYKADVFRLLVIYQYGGVYNDISHRYLQPASTWMKSADEFVMAVDADTTCPGNCLYNAFIAAYPRHPLIGKMIEFVIRNIQNREYGENGWDVTGPYVVGKAFNAFFGFGQKDLIRIGDYSLEGYRLHILKNHLIDSYEAESYVEEIDGTRCIQTKFPGYYEVMYNSKGVSRYYDLWNARKIYVEGA